MIIRNATLQDIDSLEHIESESWSANSTPLWPTLTPAFNVRLPIDNTLVAEVDGAVVGYCVIGARTLLACNRHVFSIRSLAVLPEFRQKKIGYNLIMKAEEFVRSKGGLKITLTVMSSNSQAISLYKSCGFIQEGLLKKEFLINDAWVDDILLAKHFFLTSPSKIPQ
jgi:ribosomal protein S18 acetylase RimI-like enzyme